MKLSKLKSKEPPDFAFAVELWDLEILSKGGEGRKKRVLQKRSRIL